MIDIISHGSFYKEPLQPISYKCKCYFCGCIFTFNTDDIDVDHALCDMEGKRPRKVNCPECEVENRSFHWERI